MKFIMDIFHKSACITVASEDGEWRELHIEMIVAIEKRKGHASELLASICHMCDELKLTLSLVPVANSGMSLRKLRGWYTSYGFTDYSGGMIRYPSVSHSDGSLEEFEGRN